jgi:hypothetical protein
MPVLMQINSQHDVSDVTTAELALSAVVQKMCSS